MENSKRRLSQNLSASAYKLRLDTINKILKIDSKKIKKHKGDISNKQQSRVALNDLLKKNSNGQIRDIPDFKTFLSNKDNVSVFRDFLKTQFCHENIDFYLACEKFRNLNIDRVGNEFVKFMANQIYNDFLAKSANQPINVNYDCLQNIISKIKKPDTDLFNDAQTEIFNLMRTDCYPRFCKTWQIDADIANKILHDRLVDFTPTTSKNNNSTILTSSTTNCDTTFMSASSINYNQSMSIPKLSSSRKLNRTSISSSSFVSTNKSNEHDSTNNSRNISKIGCPKNCAYFKVGLPCENHQIVKKSTLHRNEDLIDKIDIRRMHDVSNACKRMRTPPPPPLPPKPIRTARISPAIDKKLCPYVGRVFDV